MMATLRSLVVLALAVGAACENNEDPEDRHRVKVQYVSKESDANEDGPDFTASEVSNEDRHNKDLSRAEDLSDTMPDDLPAGDAAPRPAPRPRPAPTDDDGLPTEIVWTLPGAIDLDQDDAEERLFKANEDEEKASKKRPGEPDIDIVIDSDGS